MYAKSRISNASSLFSDTHGGNGDDELTSSGTSDALLRVPTAGENVDEWDSLRVSVSTVFARTVDDGV